MGKSGAARDEDEEKVGEERHREEEGGEERELLLLLLALELNEVLREVCESRRSSRLSWLSPPDEELQLPLLLLPLLS